MLVERLGMKDIKECRANKERWVKKRAAAAKRGRSGARRKGSDHSCVKTGTEVMHPEKKGGYRAALEGAHAACLAA